jgi:hypothetical protein
MTRQIPISIPTNPIKIGVLNKPNFHLGIFFKKRGNSMESNAKA